MAEDKDKKDNPYLTIGLAVAAGIVIGSLVSGASNEDVRRMNRRVAALENAAGEQISALSSRIEELDAVETAVDTGSDAMEALQARIDEVAAQLGEVSAAAPELDDDTQAAFDALSDRVNVLADQMGRIVASMLGGEPMEAMPEAAGEPAAEEPAAAPAAEPEADTDAAEADTPDAVAEDEAAGDAVAEGEAAEGEAAEGDVAEDALAAGDEIGLLLAVGDTGMVGDRRLFVSRIDTNRDAVRVMVVGEGPRMLGRGYGPLDLGNGCTVELRDIVDGMALIVASCTG